MKKITRWCWNPKYVLVTDQDGNTGLIKIRRWKKDIEIFERYVESVAE